MKAMFEYSASASTAPCAKPRAPADPGAAAHHAAALAYTYSAEIPKSPATDKPDGAGMNKLTTRRNHASRNSQRRMEVGVLEGVSAMDAGSIRSRGANRVARRVS